MAGGKRPEVAIWVTLNEEPAAKALRRLTQRFTKGAADIKASLDLISVPIGAITSSVDALGRAVLAAADKAVKFEKAVAEVASISDRATLPLQRIRDVAMEMATIYGGSSAEQAKALYEVISAGITDGARATEVLDAANKLAIGGVTSVGVAVKGLTTALNSYATQNLTAAAATDAMFIAIRDGVTTAEQLSQSLGMVTPIASQVGVSFDELTASVAVLTQKGLSTSQASEYLRSALANILKPSKQAAAVAKELGVEFNAAALQTKGWAGFLDDLVVKHKATQSQLSRLIGDVGGLTAVLALMGDGGAKLGEELDSMANKAGAADKAFETLAATTAFAIDRMKANADTMAIAFGEAFASSEGSGAAAMRGISEAFADLTKTFQDPAFKSALSNDLDAIMKFASLGLQAIALLGKGWNRFAWEVKNFGNVLTHPFGSDEEDAAKALLDGPYVKALEELSQKFGDIAAHRDRIATINADAGALPESKPGFGVLDPALADSGLQIPMLPGQKRGTGFAIEAGENARHNTKGKGKGPKLPLDNLLSDEARGLLAAGENTVADEQYAVAQHAKARKIIERQGVELAQEIAIAGTRKEQAQRAANMALVEANNEGIASLAKFGEDSFSFLRGAGDLIKSGFGFISKVTAEGAGLVKDVVSGIAGELGGAFTSIATAIGTGDWEDVSFNKFLGGLLVDLGQFAIAHGTLMGVLGLFSFLPGLQEFAAGLAAAPVLIGAGFAAVAAGAALSGSGASAKSTPSVAAGGESGGRRRAPSLDEAGGAPRLASGGQATQSITQIYQIHFGRSVIVGSEAEAGRTIERYLDQSARLRGGPRVRF